MAFFKTSTSSSNPLVALIMGPILFVGSLGLIFYNEGRAVARTQTLNEGLATVRTVSSDSPAPENEAALVHLTGSTATEETLTDSVFNISVPAIHLKRKVEMYQWDEKTTTRNNNKEYRYEKTWSESTINSGSFHDSGHDNPSSMPFSSSLMTAEAVSLDGFWLSDDFVSQLDDYRPVPAQNATVPSLPGFKASLSGNQLLFNKNGQVQDIGDLRVTFTAVDPETVSAVGKQADGILVAYQGSNGGSIALIGSGNMPASELFAQAQSENKILTWILRGVGSLVMFIGFVCLTAPITWLARWIPGVGWLVETSMAIIAICLTAIVSTLAIALSWLAVRPLLAAGLFAAALVFFLVLRRSGKRAVARSVAMPPPPPPAFAA